MILRPPEDKLWFYRNGNIWKNPASYDPSDYLKKIALNCVLRDFNLEPETPDYAIKDILLENDFTDFCETFFRETRPLCESNGATGSNES